MRIPDNLWQLELPATDFIDLSEMLKLVWGLPALKMVDGERVMLLAPVKQA